MNKIDKGPQRDAKYQISKNFEVGFLCSSVPTCDPLEGPVLTPPASYEQLGRSSQGDAKSHISKLDTFSFKKEF